MAGLVPAIHAFQAAKTVMDGRDDPRIKSGDGHDAASLFVPTQLRLTERRWRVRHRLTSADTSLGACACAFSSAGLANAASLVQRSVNRTLPSSRYCLVKQLQLPAGAAVTIGSCSIVSIISP